MMETSVVCLALLLVLMAGQSTEGAECNIEKMNKCVAATREQPENNSMAYTCRRMTVYVECYEKNGKGCTGDFKASLEEIAKTYKKQFKKFKCKITDKKEKKEKKDMKGNKKGDAANSSILQVSSLILSFSASLFASAIARM